MSYQPRTHDVHISDEFELSPFEVEVESLDSVRYIAPNNHDVTLRFPDKSIFGEKSVTIKQGQSVTLKVLRFGKKFTTFAFPTKLGVKGGAGNEGKTKVGGGG